MQPTSHALGAGSAVPENGDVLTGRTVQDVWDQESSNAVDSQGGRAAVQVVGIRSSLGDAVMSTIRGVQDAQRLVFALKDGMAPADALFDGLQAVQSTGDSERLRGFVRELQKRLERAA